MFLSERCSSSPSEREVWRNKIGKIIGSLQSKSQINLRNFGTKSTRYYEFQCISLDMYLRLNVKARTKPKFDANEQNEEVLLLKEGVDVVKMMARLCDGLLSTITIS